MSQSFSQPSTFRSVVPFRVEGDAPPLFFLHGTAGITSEFEPIYPHLPTRYPLYGIQAQGLDPKGHALTKLEDLAAYYLAEVRAVQPRGPYYLIGYSFGGTVAFEMAQQLIAAGEPPPFLGMIDSSEMTHLSRQLRDASPNERAGSLYQRLRRRFDEGFDSPNTLAYFRSKIFAQVLRRVYRIASKFRLPLPSSLRLPPHINWFAALNYQPRPFPGQIILFKAAKHVWEPGMPHDLGWGGLAEQGVEIYEIPAGHKNLFTEPAVFDLGARLTSALINAAARFGADLSTARRSLPEVQGPNPMRPTMGADRI